MPVGGARLYGRLRCVGLGPLRQALAPVSLVSEEWGSFTLCVPERCEWGDVGRLEPVRNAATIHGPPLRRLWSGFPINTLIHAPSISEISTLTWGYDFAAIHIIVGSITRIFLPVADELTTVLRREGDVGQSLVSYVPYWRRTASVVSPIDGSEMCVYPMRKCLL
jgi:hypothetical protein